MSLPSTTAAKPMCGEPQVRHSVFWASLGHSTCCGAHDVVAVLRMRSAPSTHHRAPSHPHPLPVLSSARLPRGLTRWVVRTPTRHTHTHTHTRERETHTSHHEGTSHAHTARTRCTSRRSQPGATPRRSTGWCGQSSRGGHLMPCSTAEQGSEDIDVVGGAKAPYAGKVAFFLFCFCSFRVLR